MAGDEVPPGLDDGIGGAKRKFHPAGGGGLVDPVDETFAGEDGGRGDGGVGLALGALFESEGEAFLLECSLEDFGPGELIAEGARAVRPGGGEFLDDAGVPPG